MAPQSHSQSQGRCLDKWAGYIDKLWYVFRYHLF